MTDAGLACGSDLILLPTITRSNGQELSLDGDQSRVVALVSVAVGRPLAAPDVLVLLEAVADHWRRGDKALANFRLLFSGLPRLSPDDVRRLRLATGLLDSGVSPSWLMDELWPPSPPLGKYNPAQPRVPAGHGVESGRWGSDAGTSHNRSGRDRSGWIDVAAGPGRPEDEKEYEERRLLGGTTPEEDVRHLIPSIRWPACRAASVLRLPAKFRRPSGALRRQVLTDPDEAQRKLAEWEDCTIGKLKLEAFR